jgi:hypothetical protein
MGGCSKTSVLEQLPVKNVVLQAEKLPELVTKQPVLEQAQVLNHYKAGVIFIPHFRQCYQFLKTHLPVKFPCPGVMLIRVRIANGFNNNVFAAFFNEMFLWGIMQNRNRTAITGVHVTLYPVKN